VAVDATRFLQHGLEGGSRSYADRLDALGLPGPLALAGRAWLGALQVVSWAWLALGALGALPLLLRGRGRERIGFAVFAAAWLCMAGLIAATHGGLWRYSMSVAPLTWIVGAAGAGFLVGRVRAGWRDRRSIVPRS
jgi:hypothetical protein